ncbi:MAG: hypothetical protein ABEJ56_05605 [Candidatus Nanohaloarchaea archaeon]
MAKQEFECDNCMETFYTEKKNQECSNCGADAVSKIVRDLNQEEDTLSV